MNSSRFACLAALTLFGPSPLDRALHAISESSLRANLSFLASDALAGRWTPSPGLDAAAEFIASRFREAGIEPANGPDYFQYADLKDLANNSRWMHGKKIDTPINARNIAGLLRGSDPRLRDTYVIVSAHYDHLGTLATGADLSQRKTSPDGDQIFNGANDDGSGTVSVIEIASAFAKAKLRPKRSILFLLFCGEERGELGSLYYVDHPLFPLNQTMADINIEQVGRSDSDLGKGNATMTGYGYTTITPVVERAAAESGVRMVKTKETDPYFEASDNFSFARAGIPDLTIGTSYDFPDYHGLKDEWQKIDFPELAKMDRLIARVLWTIANSSNAPQWNAENPKTEKYRKAAKATK